MSITRINNSTALTGTIPAVNFANSTLNNVTSLPNAPLGDMVLVSSATASSSASIEFSLGNYKEYKFFFVNMHPATDSVTFSFNLSTDGGSNYNVVKTTTAFYSYHFEADTGNGIGYYSAQDLAQSTADQPLSVLIGNDNDQTCSGTLQLFNPSSNTFVKHFIARCNAIVQNDGSQETPIAGYANTTSALTNIRFKMSSGNIDAGKILMFGIN